jgi:hypothetical protein
MLDFRNVHRAELLKGKIMQNQNQNQVFEIFLRRLLAAPQGRQQSAINSAIALLDGSPPEDRILYNGREAAKLISVSTQTLWRLVKSGAIQTVVIPGMKNPRYRRADIEKLADGSKK